MRFGYRRLTVMLRCEGWKAKRVYSLYTEDGLAVRTKVRGKIALRARVPALRATRSEREVVDGLPLPRDYSTGAGSGC